MSSLATEFEMKFIIDDRDQLIAKLHELWATQLYPSRLMRRVNMNPASGYDGKARWRIRDEGDCVTCTFKTLTDNTDHIACVSEVECVVSDFDAMIAIFQWLGVDYQNYQETYREKRVYIYQWQEVELCLDRRPGLPAFVEIEWPNQSIVETVSTLYGFNLTQSIFWSADLLYEKLGICTAQELNERKNLTFDDYPWL
jgi:predicted adenylyl cyclase CyaB